MFFLQHVFDMNKSMKDDSVPSGVNWLCHPKAMLTYITLLGTSQKDLTREACCGALQNLTAHNGPVRDTQRWGERWRGGARQGYRAGCQTHFGSGPHTANLISSGLDQWNICKITFVNSKSLAFFFSRLCFILQPTFVAYIITRGLY